MLQFGASSKDHLWPGCIAGANDLSFAYGTLKSFQVWLLVVKINVVLSWWLMVWSYAITFELLTALLTCGPWLEECQSQSICNTGGTFSWSFSLHIEVLKSQFAAARSPAGSCSFPQVLTSCGSTWSSCSKMMASPTLSLVFCSSWSPCTRLSLTRPITLKAVSFIFPQSGYGRHKISNRLYQLVLIHCPKWLEVNEDFLMRKGSLEVPNCCWGLFIIHNFGLPCMHLFQRHTTLPPSWL